MAIDLTCAYEQEALGHEGFQPVNPYGETADFERLPIRQPLRRNGGFRKPSNPSKSSGVTVDFEKLPTRQPLRRNGGFRKASNPSKSSGMTVDFDTLKPMLMRQFFAAGKKPSSNMGGDLNKVIADHFVG